MNFPTHIPSRGDSTSPDITIATSHIALDLEWRTLPSYDPYPDQRHDWAEPVYRLQRFSLNNSNFVIPNNLFQFFPIFLKGFRAV